MSGSLGSLNIQLALDSVRFQQNLTSAERKARQFSAKTTEYLSNIEKAANSINNATQWDWNFQKLGLVKTLASNALEMSERYTELGNKLKLITENSTQHAQAMQAVYDISLKTAQSTQAVSSVYQSFAQNAKELGINQRQVAEITETVSKAVAISGASTATAQNALTQFSQTLLMGKMKSQEFNSIMTQTPSIIQSIANGLGITTAQFKAMVDDGKMSSDKLIEGLQKAQSSVDELYNKTATTLSGAMQNLSTGTEKWIGELDSTIGLSQTLANTINTLAKNVEFFAPVLLNMGLAWGTVRLSQRAKESIELAMATRQKALASMEAARSALANAQNETLFARTAMQSLQAQLQLARTEQERTIIRERMKAQSAQIVALTNAETVAANNLANAKRSVNLGTNLFSGALSFLGGPVGATTVALTFLATATYEWFNRAEQARLKSLEFANSLGDLKEKIASMDAISLNSTKAKLEESAIAQQGEIKKLEREVNNLNQEIKRIPKLEIMVDDYGYEITIDNTAKLAKLQRELAQKEEELRDKRETLNATTEQANDVSQRLADITESQLANSAERLGLVMFNTDQETQQFNSSMLIAANNAENTESPLMSMANKIFGVGEAARSSAKDLYVFSHAARTAMLGQSITENVPQIDPKTQKFIDSLNRQNKITQAKGNEKVKLQAEDLLIQQGLTPEMAGYKEAMEAATTKFQLNMEKTLSKAGGGGSKKGGKSKKDKEADKAKRESERAANKAKREKEKAEKKAAREAEQAAKKSADKAKRNRENYLNQVTEMSLRLSGLKDEAAEIALFGQTSQYQEVKKLTEDIALNAEKYKGYGTEGIAKLKELAYQINSENQNVAIAKFDFENNERLNAMKFELSLLGKTRQEAELLQYNHQLDLEAAKLQQGMTQENIAKLNQKLAKLKEIRAELQLQTEQKRSEPMEGIKGAWNDIEDNATNVAENVKNVTVGAFNSMSDALTNFVMTGKADFRSMAVSILKDISAMMIKMALFNAIKQGMSFMGYSDGGLVGGVNSSFAVGGYTGDGGKYTPAGIVHRGEYVITKEATARIGRGYLDYLNYGSRRGFATGGGVAVPNMPMLKSPMGNAMTSNNVSITINIDQNGNAESDTQEQSQNGKQLGKMIESKVLEVLATQRRAGGMFA